ncbi:MAG: SDR family oxidoreductase [Oscillospiraceae bacterium]|nr:SDR family oxidoreductase [Oscillospiraceae bacterium]MDD3833146.1 SDR family oxidoreductase [Oscillospiraceae bacterium]MDD4414240.1 SDR family oxidoreductase [Oscillospiraceae bacterium]
MNNTVVITGAGGVLCSTFAKAMAAVGYPVALLDLNESAAQAVANEINQMGGNAKAYKANVLEKDNLESVHKQIVKDLGKCRILINGAGGNSPKCTTANETFKNGDESKTDISTFFNLDKSGFGFVFDLNLMGTLLPTQVFVKDMLGADGCSILNISSMNAFRPLTKIPAYSAAKAAVSNFTQWLAVHFAEQGIRVNAMAPGFFVTNQNSALLFDENGEPTPRAEKILGATPMGRFGEAEELVGTLLWLTDSKASGFVTGIVVPVDGGFSAYSGV